MLLESLNIPLTCQHIISDLSSDYVMGHVNLMQQLLTFPYATMLTETNVIFMYNQSISVKEQHVLASHTLNLKSQSYDQVNLSLVIETSEVVVGVIIIKHRMADAHFFHIPHVHEWMCTTQTVR